MGKNNPPKWAKKALEKQEAKAKGGGSFMELNDGVTYVRILPSWRGEDEQFYREGAYHYQIGPDKKTVSCARIGGGRCFLCEEADRFFKAGDKETGKALKAKSRFFANAINLNSKEKKVETLAFGSTILKAILRYLVDTDDEWGEWWSEDNRYDFKIEKSGKGLDTEYTVFATRKFKDVDTDGEPVDLDALAGEPLSYKNMKALYEGDEVEEEEEADDTDDSDDDTDSDESTDDDEPKKKKGKAKDDDEEEPDDDSDDDADEPDESTDDDADEPDEEEPEDDDEPKKKKKGKSDDDEEEPEDDDDSDEKDEEEPEDDEGEKDADDEEEPDEEEAEEKEDEDEAPECFKDPMEHDPKSPICKECDWRKECRAAVEKKIEANPKKFKGAPLVALTRGGKETVEKELKKAVSKVKKGGGKVKPSKGKKGKR